MHFLLKICLFSAVVAVALCGVVVRDEDLAVMEETAHAVLKMHKLRMYQFSCVTNDQKYQRHTSLDSARELCILCPLKQGYY